MPLILLCLFLASDASAQTRLEFGREATAEIMASDMQLDDGSFYQEFVFAATAGATVVITARTTNFDAFLDLGRYDANYKWQSLATDDDSGGGRDARLRFTVPADGEYVVRANTLNSNRTGRYTILLTRDN